MKRKKIPQKKAIRIKCRLCGEIIKSTKWRRHLIDCHKVGDNPRRRDFFIGINVDISKAQREWYNPDRQPKSESKKQSDCPCGTVIAGPPRVRIIYNPIFSNKKKF